MSSLAILLRRAGYIVSGSDLAFSPLVDELRSAGVEVSLGHAAHQAEAASLVIRSSAVSETNPEIARAHERGVTVLKHSQMMGLFSETYRTLAVAGTHGKTTTTAMLATVLIQAGLDPIALVGGVVPCLGSGAHLGSGELFVVEADEFDRRFLELRPEIAIVTNVEADHLDYYGTFDAIREAFEGFLDRVSEDGWIVTCSDYPASAALADRRPDQTVTYGTGELAEWRAAGLTPNDLGGNDFVVYAHDTLVGRFSLRVPGRHNVTNALAAAVAAGRIGVDFTTAAAALEKFTGVRRRLELIGQASGVTVVDDYAHHPTKIRASLAALREQHDGRIVCLFQPHHFHRLSSLFHDFARAFEDADLVVVADVYSPAGRGPDEGERTSAELARAIGVGRAIYAGALLDATDVAFAVLKPGDLIVTMGAGDVTSSASELLKHLTSHGRSS